MYLPPFKSQSKLEIIGKLGPKIACGLKNYFNIGRNHDRKKGVKI